MMEDEERQKKLQAGKAKLAEYRQKKAQSDGQKKQKKKKKKPESDVEEQRDQTTVFSLSKTLRSGETVTHDQTYTIEPESEVSTTAEDCSSEVNGFHERTSSVIGEEDLQPSEAHMEPQSHIPNMEDELAAKNLALEELSRELEEIRGVFGAEGVQQLQDFEEALKQRDEIITQLTSNLQQARTEKEEEVRGQGRAVTEGPELSSDVVTTERDVLRQANARLRQALVDVLKTTAAAEETIGRHVQGILEASSEGRLRSFWEKETGQTHINTHCSSLSLYNLSEIIRGSSVKCLCSAQVLRCALESFKDGRDIPCVSS
uniref:Uncharacterized protein n=1 Tax=Cyprinus carpio TaxID=7962 RepID=A0A8C1PFT3_CYPCA